MDKNAKKVLGTLAIAGAAVGGFILYKKGKKLFPAAKMHFALLGFRIHSVDKTELKFAVKLRCYNPTKETIQLSITQVIANYKDSPMAFSKPDITSIEIETASYQEHEIMFQVPFMNLVGKGILPALSNQAQFQQNLSFTLTVTINGETITTKQKLTDENMKGLGIVSGPRNTQNGARYNHLIQPAAEREIFIKDGNVYETVKSCMYIVATYYKQVAPLAEMLKAGTLKETCKNIFDFAYKFLQYRLDEQGTEQLRTPARSWHDGQILFMQKGDKSKGIDCDDFSIFCGSLLKCLNINFKFRITKYDGKTNFQHIYIFVPAPGDSEDEIIIDPVLSKFDYQKPFSFEKSDFNMSPIQLAGHSGLGLPISVLSGIDLNSTLVKDDEFQELMGIVTGADFEDSINGLGNAEDATLKYLVRTRDFLLRNKANRSKMAHIQNPEQFISMLDQAIKYWNTPDREKVLDKLVELEDKLAESGYIKYDIDAMQGVDEFDDLEEDLEGLDGRGRRRARRKARREKRKTRRARFFKAVKRAGKKVVKAHVKVAKKVANVAKKAAKAVVRFNPLSIAIRGGLLAALRVNMFGISKKLQYAYLPDHLANQYNIDPNKLRELKQVHGKVKKLFKGLQGKEENLKKSILKGAKQGSKDFSIKGLQGLQAELRHLNAIGELAELGELGDPATGASIAAASGVLATIKKWLGPVKNIFNKSASKRAARREKRGKPVSERLKQRASQYVAPSTQPPTLPEPVPYTENSNAQYQPEENFQDMEPPVVSQAIPSNTTTPPPPEKKGLSKNAKMAIAVAGILTVGAGVAYYYSSNNRDNNNKETTKKKKQSLGAISLQ